MDKSTVGLADLFKYNPTPWTHARCGHNWDINLPSAPGDKGVGVVATVFAGESIARLIAAAPELYEALDNICSAFPGDAPALIEARRALAKARGE